MKFDINEGEGVVMGGGTITKYKWDGFVWLVDSVIDIRSFSAGLPAKSNLFDKVAEPTCECGAGKVGGMHSNWCALWVSP